EERETAVGPEAAMETSHIARNARGQHGVAGELREPCVRRRLYRDERGMSFVFIGLGFTAFLAATTLAVDVGLFMTARSQAQNAADAGALAGVTALAFNDFNNRSASGPAVQSAINTAAVNKVAGGAPSVLPADVTF